MTTKAAAGVFMKLGIGWGACRTAVSAVSRRLPVAALSLFLAGGLAGCNTTGQTGLAAGQPRGATVAFESIDGPPPGQFTALVRNLNDEAQQRRLAVLSRDAASAYRVRGYLAAKVSAGRTTISWVWDVFDRDEKRALRINGEEVAVAAGKKSSKDDAWNVADDAMLRRIAAASMDQLAAFLTSPDVAPNAPAAAVTPVALIGPADTSPEAAGIYRIFRANADPSPTQVAGATQGSDAPAAPVPLPQAKPDEALSATETRPVHASL
jgi:hypothetical protein